MKQRLCVLIIAALLLGLCGCVQLTAYQPSTTATATLPAETAPAQYISGTISGNIYENAWLDLRFELPSGMEFEDQLTHDRYNQVQIEQHPHDYTVQDLTVFSTFDTEVQSPIIVYVTKLTDGEQSPGSLVDAWRANIDATYRDAESRYNTTIGARWSEPETILFLGYPYILQHHTTAKTEFWDLFRVHDGYLVNVHFADTIDGWMELTDFIAFFTTCAGFSDSTTPTETESTVAAGTESAATEPKQTTPTVTGGSMISCLDFGKQLLELTEDYEWSSEYSGFNYSCYVPGVYELAGLYASDDSLSFYLFNNRFDYVGKSLDYGTNNDQNQLSLVLESNDGATLEELLWYASPLFDSCPNILSRQELVSRFSAAGERNYTETVGNISYEISFDIEFNELTVAIRFGKGYTLSVTEPDPIKVPFDLNKVYRMTVYAEGFSEPCAVDFMLSEGSACYMLAGTQYEAMVGYIGTYSVEGDELTMNVTYHPNSDPIHCLFSYKFDPDDGSVVQLSEQAPFGTESGTWFSVSKNQSMDSDKMKDMTEYYSS